MKKLSWFLLGPVFLNIVTFFRTYLYDPVVMFTISFAVFFLSLYIDFNDRTKRKWGVVAAIDIYMTLAVLICSLNGMNWLVPMTVIFICAAFAACFSMTKKHYN